ncbi:MAG: 50S ribosomal protein L23 [Patescibacteria group bacterium]|jgi:large subunit ribosomal protein L23
MGIFDRIKKPASTNVAAKADKKQKPVEKASEDTIVSPKVAGGSSSRMLVSPRVSEKAAILASKGTYVFNVPLSANKVEVRKAVEALYKVHVNDVRMVRGKGKIVTRARIAGARKDWKKALVTLKKGETLDLYAGV